MKKKYKLKYKRIILCFLIMIVLILIIMFLISLFKHDPTMENFVNKNVSDINKFALENDIKINYTYEYNDTIVKDIIISQDIKKEVKLKDIKEINIVVSKGKLDKEQLKNDKIDELGNVPIMMYHGIVDIKSSETKYIGGNVDKDGYNRTVEAFRNDLEFYYNNDYRMVRLIDYVNGKIDVEYGKSPIILTFDDGNENNMKIDGINEDGSLKISENCAVGVLESFKKKYPDYHVTATFFVNGGLFNQKEYNDKILEWLVNNGYDIGNHTKSHVNFKNVSTSKSEEEMGFMYELLESIIPGKYVNIVALPFGSPGSSTHANFSHILNSTYNGKTYETISALRVGWEADLSPFNKTFNKLFLKRIRAYDNNGLEFDIEMSFNNLKKKRYVSDGNVDRIVIPSSKKSLLFETNLETIEY